MDARAEAQAGPEAGWWVMTDITLLLAREAVVGTALIGTGLLIAARVAQVAASWADGVTWLRLRRTTARRVARVLRYVARRLAHLRLLARGKHRRAVSA